MISWEEYIKSNVTDYRKHLKKTSADFQNFIKESRKAYVASLVKPSQIIVATFAKPYPKCLIMITHVDEHPDMDTIIFEDMAYESFLENASKDPRLTEIIGNEEIENITKWMKEAILTDFPWDFGYEDFEKTFAFLSREDPRSPKNLLRNLWSELLSHNKWLLFETRREKQREKIQETIGDINKDAEGIPIANIRTKILESTESLASEIQQLHEHYKELSEEVVGVRKLVGTKSFGEWKALVSDVDELKGEHLPREVFDTEVRRIDEKIDRGLDAVNMRIEDLKAIKFWSKRTLLEIALAIIAVIAALYGAGVIKF